MLAYDQLHPNIVMIRGQIRLTNDLHSDHVSTRLCVGPQNQMRIQYLNIIQGINSTLGTGLSMRRRPWHTCPQNSPFAGTNIRPHPESQPHIKHAPATRAGDTHRTCSMGGFYERRPMLRTKVPSTYSCRRPHCARESPQGVAAPAVSRSVTRRPIHHARRTHETHTHSYTHIHTNSLAAPPKRGDRCARGAVDIWLRTRESKCDEYQINKFAANKN